jgi:hypothetical protein
MTDFIEVDGVSYPIPTDDPNLPSYVSPNLIPLRLDSEFCWDMYDPTRFYHPLSGVVDEQKCQHYYPQEEMEDSKSYSRRLQLSPISRKHRASVDGMVDLLSNFEVLPETGAELTKLFDNVNLRGDSLSQFLRKTDQFALNDLLAPIYVEYPGKADLQNRLQQREAGVRPWFVQLSLNDVPNWSYYFDEDGVFYLSQLTFIHRKWVDDGAYGAREEVQYKRLTPGLCQTYEIRATVIEGSVTFISVLVDERETTLSYIPVVMYSLTGAYSADQHPALFPSATLNLIHSKKTSDVNLIVHEGSNITPVRVMEWKKDSPRPPIVKGPGYGIDLPPGGEFFFAEPAGHCLAGAQKDLELLNTEFEELNSSYLSNPTGGMSATEAGYRAAASTVTLYGMAQGKESCVQTLFSIAADFMALDSVGGIQVSKRLGDLSAETVT